MMRFNPYCFLLIGMFVLSGTGMVHAQSGTRTVLVLDSTDEQAIPDVAVTVDDAQHRTTDGEGKAEVPWDGRSSVVVRFEHVSYRTLEVHIDEAAQEEGPWVVRLVPSDHQLGTVTVGRVRPEVVFERPDLHAADLLINDEGLWVLAYEHPRMLRAQADASKEILRDVRLVLLDTAFNEVASCPVPEDVFGLRHDLRNDVVIEGAVHAFGVGRRGKDIALRPFGLDELRHSVLPWTDSIPGWVIGSNADPTYPELDHLAFDPRRDSTRRICSVVDTFMMDLFRSEYKYMKGPDKVVAMNLAAQLGVDKETVAGYMSGFSHNIWYRPMYAPLFVVGDTMLVFDNVRGRMRKFTRSFKAMGEVPLPYHAKTEGRYWSGRLIQDRATEQVYALFRKYGTTWLRAIDPVSGALGAPFRLANSYPDRVQVHAGKVYYIWRPYGSLQKRTIYRETLKR
jgi:hypothetical protein